MIQAEGAAAEGWTAPGFESAASAFDSQLERGLHEGAQLCVMLGGKVVLERHGGFTDGSRRRRVRADTPFMVFSATKALTAASIHKLADKGALELEAPVADYWPAFAARGKGGITIEQLLLHQAGLACQARPADLAAWLLPGGGARRVRAMAPAHEPGAKVVYHAFSAGFALGELIRRASGMGAARYLEKVFLEPLGMKDSSAGLRFRDFPRAALLRSADPEQEAPARLFSNPIFRKAYLPAASLNSSARDLAAFYDMLRAGGERGGRRFLSARAVARATELRYDGPDGDTGRRIRWALGFGLGGYSPFPDRDVRHMGRGATERTFGHSGQGGCAFGWADPPSGLVFAFTCNRFLDIRAAHERFQELADACWEALGA